MAVELALITAPTEADRDAIHRPLIAYNAAKAGPAHYKPLAIVLRDETGVTIGGLWGDCYYEWLFIELLFVPEQLRLQQFGTRLLAEAEVFARQNHSDKVALPQGRMWPNRQPNGSTPLRPSCLMQWRVNMADGVLSLF